MSAKTLSRGTLKTKNHFRGTEKHPNGVEITNNCDQMGSKTNQGTKTSENRAWEVGGSIFVFSELTLHKQITKMHGNHNDVELNLPLI